MVQTHLLNKKNYKVKKQKQKQIDKERETDRQRARIKKLMLSNTKRTAFIQFWSPYISLFELKTTPGLYTVQNVPKL